MFDGSAIATMRLDPARLIGMTWCFSQISFGISFRTSGLISISPRLIAGRLYWRATNCVSSESLTNPRRDRVAPRRLPVRLASSCAC